MSAISPGVAKLNTHRMEIDGEVFIVKRPTRKIQREINQNIAVATSIVQGATAAHVLSMLDGDMIEAEETLALVLVEAPSRWWGKDPNGDPVIFSDDLYEEEITKVRGQVVAWLNTFRYPRKDSKAGERAGGEGHMGNPEEVPSPPAV